MVRSPVNHGGPNDTDHGEEGKDLFHKRHGRSPSSQKAPKYNAVTQMAPTIIKTHDAWPVTHGLTKVINATPFAMSYRNLVALVRCRSFIEDGHTIAHLSRQRRMVLKAERHRMSLRERMAA